VTVLFKTSRDLFCLVKMRTNRI